MFLFHFPNWQAQTKKKTSYTRNQKKWKEKKIKREEKKEQNKKKNKKETINLIETYTETELRR